MRATVARRPEAAEHDRPYHAAPRGSSHHLGSPETISDDSGASYHERFEPFGAPIDAPNPELSRVGFTGQDHDNDLGLIDMKGRIYDPLAGRFLTPDPVTQAPFWSQGLNRYSYVFNNPINNTDPSGFETNWEGGAPVYWGAATVGLAAGLGTGVGAGALGVGLGIGALNPATSLLTGQYNLFNGSDPYTRSGTAPTTAPKGTGYNRLGGAGATGDNKGGNELARPPGSSLFDPARGALAQNFQLGGYCHEDGPCHDFIPVMPLGMVGELLDEIANAVRSVTKWLRDPPVSKTDRLSEAGRAADRAGLTKAGRALAKHGGRQGSVFPRATGNPLAINEQGQAALDDILGNVSKTSPNKFGGIDYFGGSRGGGVRYDSAGNLMGFLEP